MNKSLWFGLALLAASALLIVTRQLACVSGGYFASVHVGCWQYLSAGVALSVMLGLALLIAGCIIKAATRGNQE